MTVSRFILKMAFPFKGPLLFSFFTSIVWAIDISLRPYLTKCAVDALLLHNSAEKIDTFSFYIAAYMGLLVFVSVINIAEEYLLVKFYAPVRVAIGNHLFGVLLKQGYTFFQNNFAGSLIGKLNNCVVYIPRIITILNNTFFRYLLALILSCYTLWQVDFKFAMGLCIWACFYIISSIVMAPYVKKISMELSDAASTGYGYKVDSISNMLSVKLFCNQDKEKEVVRLNFATWSCLIQTRDFTLVHLYTFQTLSFILFQGLCVYWLWQRVGTVYANAGDFILIFSITYSIYTCLQGITRTIADFSEGVGTIAEALSVLYKKPLIQDSPQAKPLHITQGSIAFDKVGFHYKGTSALFHNQSLTIGGGEKVGLVGYSGGGKTTFVNLIMRLYDVTSGRICIDGQDIRHVLQDSLHKAIAMIPQDPTLFHRSLMENIRYGQVNATDEQFINAAKQAHCHSFIKALPQGYQSLVGERGVKLSGGQRQRIAIARAILKASPILILDEATSQLDSLTEQAIQTSLWHLMQNKTTLIIAHRLSTLQRMDRILVFEKGRIVEDGTHAMLISKKGTYAKLWDAQVGEFLKYT